MVSYKWLTAGFVLLLALIVLIANLGLGPVVFPFIYQHPGLDKVGHFILMGLLSFLVNTLFGGRKIELYSGQILLGSLIVLLAAVLEELSQIFLIYRTFSLLDLAFDLGGILLGGRLSGWVLNRRSGSGKAL